MASDRDVLELRVHGVSNTPPQSMLDLPVESLTEYGDDLGGFWSIKDDARATLTEQDRGWVPDGVRREAYSWGAFARTSTAVPGFAEKALGAAARVGWILLMPFGLANVAFWSRLPDPGRSGETHLRMPSAGHRTMRLFALTLTLIYVMTLVEIFVDLIAVQCMARERTCSGLPTAVDVIRSWTTGQRAVLGILVVLVVVGALIRLSLSSNVRYETITPPATMHGELKQQASSTHVLSDAGFWSRPNSKRHLLWVHMYAAAAVLVGTMAFDWNFRGAFAAPGSVLSTLSPASKAAWFLLTFAALSVLGYVVVYLCRRSQSSVVHPDGSMKETEAPHWLVRVITVLMLVGMIAALALETPTILNTKTDSLPGVITPSVMSSPGPVLLALVAIGLVLAGSAWSLRTARTWRQVAVLAIAALIVGVLAFEGVFHGSIPALWSAGIIVVVVGGAHLLADRKNEGARRYAYSGRAASVFMMVSLGFAVLLGSAATLSVGDWLNGCYSAADLMPGDMTERCAVPKPADPADATTGAPAAVAAPAASTAAAAAPSTDPSVVSAADLTGPAVFQMAGALILPCVLGAALLLSLWAFLNRRREIPMAPRYGGKPDGDALIDRRRPARSRAALLRRGESLISLLAAVVLVNLAFAVGLAASAEKGNRDHTRVLIWTFSVGAISTALLTVFLVGLLASSGSNSTRRPFGLVWDLMCFLPRDGHPLSPPCYAERAVPELTARILSWNHALELPIAQQLEVGSRRRVILSGHSLGGVLCAAAIMQLPKNECRQLGLITYGSQLQAYFSRIFPVLLGPQVLGVPAVTAFPFWDTRIAPAHLSARWDGYSMRARLGGRVELPLPASPTHDNNLRWRSLWRATDPLGFPVDSGKMQPGPYAIGPVDHGADEIDATGYMPVVQTHSDYPRSADYRTMLDQLTALRITP